MDLKRYSVEIENISEKLFDLEQGNYHERTKRPGVPTAKTIAYRLKQDIRDLLNKIENELPSTQEKIDETMKNFYIPISE